MHFGPRISHAATCWFAGESFSSKEWTIRQGSRQTELKIDSDKLSRPKCYKQFALRISFPLDLLSCKRRTVTGLLRRTSWHGKLQVNSQSWIFLRNNPKFPKQGCCTHPLSPCIPSSPINSISNTTPLLHKTLELLVFCAQYPKTAGQNRTNSSWKSEFRKATSAKFAREELEQWQ